MVNLINKVRNFALTGIAVFGLYSAESAYSAEVPRIVEKTTLLGQPAVKISYVTETNTLYKIQAKTDLSSTNWVDLASNINGDGRTNFFKATVSGNAKFYRVLDNK